MQREAPGVSIQHFGKAELIQELASRPGLIPIDIDVDEKRLIWMDLETYHCYEGFLHKAIGMFAALKLSNSKPSPIAVFTSALDLLDGEELLTDFIYPTGFIFHAGRCGSTLLAKALARDRQHLVLSEAAAHNRIWPALPDRADSGTVNSERNSRIYKHLVLAMARKRLQTYKAHFIKFTSFNILFFDFIRTAFPDVPAIFLYRNPANILSSFCRRPPAWLSSESSFHAAPIVESSAENLREADVLATGASAILRSFSAALHAGTHGLRYLNYDRLSAANLPTILQSLNACASKKQLGLMQSQFLYDSRGEYTLREFNPVNVDQYSLSPAIGECVWGRLTTLYDQLGQSEWNLV